MALKDDLISYWKLEEESGTRVDAHDDHDLTDYNTVLYSASGKIDNAADFESGNGEYLECLSHADLQFEDDDFTLACWVKLESATGVYRFFMTKSTIVTATGEYSLDFITSGKARFIITNGTTQTLVTSTDSLVADTWYYIVGWHDKTENKIYIQVNNGTPDEAAHSVGCQASTNPFRLGAYYGTSGDNYMDGLIDEAAVWGRVLTADERTALYNSGDGLSYDDFDSVVLDFTPQAVWF